MSKNVAEALRIIGSALMLQKEDRDRLNAAIDAVEADMRPAISRGGTTGAAPAAKPRKRAKK